MALADIDGVVFDAVIDDIVSDGFKVWISTLGSEMETNV